MGRRALSVAQELGCSQLFINSRALSFSHLHMGKKKRNHFMGMYMHVCVCTYTCGCVYVFKNYVYTDFELV